MSLHAAPDDSSRPGLVVRRMPVTHSPAGAVPDFVPLINDCETQWFQRPVVDVAHFGTLFYLLFVIIFVHEVKHLCKNERIITK